MINNIEENQLHSGKASILRIVAKREDEKEPFAVNVPVKEDEFSLVLPNGYINWPEGKPYPDPVRVEIDDEKSLWLNFGVSKKHGFYATLNISENSKD